MTAPLKFGWRMPDFPEEGPSRRPWARHGLSRPNPELSWISSTAISTLRGPATTSFRGPPTWTSRWRRSKSWTLITYLMATYPKMSFCPSVLNQAYRSPALVAKMAAVLQLLSGGRLILGIGAGWKENEQRAYGYDFPPHKVRLDQLEESVQIIRKMWTEDAPTFQGKYYSIKNAYCSPRPDPVPPLLIGGFGPKRTLKIVAKYADWCNINGSDLDFLPEPA